MQYIYIYIYTYIVWHTWYSIYYILYIIYIYIYIHKEIKRDKVKVYIEYIILYTEHIYIYMFCIYIYIYIYVYVYVNNRSFGCNITIIQKAMHNSNNASKLILILLWIVILHPNSIFSPPIRNIYRFSFEVYFYIYIYIMYNTSIFTFYINYIGGLICFIHPICVCCMLLIYNSFIQQYIYIYIYICVFFTG